MVNKYFILGIFLVLLVAVSISLSSKVNSIPLNSCGTNPTVAEFMLDDPLFSYDDFDPIIDVALQDSTCGQLKSSACGTGTCKDGWKCMDSGAQCLCSPPN